MKRCVHCLREFSGTTKDHVFPASWYPETTDAKVQRWTVPSCGECNNKFGALEKELLVQFGLCIDPRKWAALGLSKKALRTLGVGVQNLPSDEAAHRAGHKKKVLSGMRPVTPEMSRSVLPGFGPHEGFSLEVQPAVLVPAKVLIAVMEKVVRGCECKIAKRYVEPPYRVDVFFPQGGTVPALAPILAKGETKTLGPGLTIERATATDDPKSAMYRLLLWETFVVYAVILTPDEEQRGL